MLRQLHRDIYTGIAQVQPIDAIEYGIEERVPAKAAPTTQRFVTLTSSRHSDVGCRPLRITPERLQSLQSKLKWTCNPDAAVLLPDALCEGYMTVRGTRAFRLKSDVSPTSALDALIDATLNLSEPVAVAITLMWLLRAELDDEDEFDQQMHQAWITEDFVANTVFQHVFSCKQVVGTPCSHRKALSVVSRTPSALVQWRGCTAFLGSPPEAVNTSLGQRRMLTLTDGRVAYFAPGKDVNVLAPHWKLELIMQPYADAVTLLKHRSQTEFELKGMIPAPPFVVTFKTATSHVQTYDPFAVVGVVTAEKLFIRTAVAPVSKAPSTGAIQEVVLDQSPPTTDGAVSTDVDCNPKTPPEAPIEPTASEHQENINAYFDRLDLNN
jgi:hypothetical protein